MSLISTLDRVHFQVKQNRWMRYFTVFNRVALAAGFLPSGYMKVVGERFTSLAINHPMGNYLEALHHTAYYYTFIGIAQMTAAVLLLIPRTVTLGALLYFPIILNICILSFAVRFDGSLLSSPLMVLSNLYLLCWDYDKIKFILPFNHSATLPIPKTKALGNQFPALFFGGVVATVILMGLVVMNAFTIRPRNTVAECESQCQGSSNPEACQTFCACIHQQGKPINHCLAEYNRALDRTRK